MSDTNPVPPLPQEAPKKSKKGCLVYGCLALLVLAVLFSISLFLTVRSAMKAVNEFTDTQSVPLPAITLSVDDQKTLERRVATFKEALAKSGSGPAELSLSGDEINALLDGAKQAGPLAKYLRVRIEGDKVLAAVSVPLEELHLAKQPGRYLNGEASLNVGLSDGTPRISVQDLKVRGKSLPEPVLMQLKAGNLAQDFQKDPNLGPLLNKLDSVEVKEGRIVIRSKGNKAP